MGFARSEELSNGAQRSVHSFLTLRAGEDEALGSDPADQSLSQSALATLR
ncbi:hypothetical protein SAMN04488047_11825 [Tranquillimonas alkanivorans]|uniref:Uncharacterized protein n=2 Tax=Tranquillimonas alkanivorans TaxID=441119 RepID=A0A1I5U7Y5_9RHOB|nr:hypothetical protein SAMN04488047_11825 [Tranquillimonas alkanivorans]